MTDWSKHTFTIEEARELPKYVITELNGAKIRVHDLIVLIHDYYEGRPTGGNLHCCLDDGNMDGVAWELEEVAKKAQDEPAILIGTLLLMLPERERFLLYERGYHPRQVLDEWQFEGGEGFDANRGYKR